MTLPVNTDRPPDYFLLHKNLIASKSQERTSDLDNFIAKEKGTEDHFLHVNKNSAKDPFDHSTVVSQTHSARPSVVTDHVISGNIESIFNSGTTQISLDNADTDVEYSGYSILGSGDGSDLIVDDEDITNHKAQAEHSSIKKWGHFVKTSLFSISRRVNQYRHSSERLLTVGTYDRHPLARDDRFIKTARYPKDRGKEMESVLDRKGEKDKSKHSRVSDLHDRRTNVTVRYQTGMLCKHIIVLVLCRINENNFMSICIYLKKKEKGTDMTHD